MATVLDSSVVIAAFDAGDDAHDAVVRLLDTLDDELVTTPLAVAEMDHLVLARGGEHAQRRLWDDLRAGVMAVRWWADGMRDTLGIVDRHPYVGLADASLVALTRVARTDRIATLDHHFRSLTTPDGQPLTVLPD